MSLRIRRRFAEENDVTLFHGDCVALLRTIPTRSAQVVVTSPPYNLGKPYEKRTALSAYLDFQKTVISECVRILRPGGSICWQVGHYVDAKGNAIPLDLLVHPLFADYTATHQLRLRNRIVWHFEHGLHCTRRFSGRYETVLWYSKGDKYLFNLDAVRVPQKYPGKRAYKGPHKGHYSGNPKGKNPGDVWVFPNVKANHAEKTEHPCQFPVELPERFILALSRTNDLVVDPFLGVGSTGVAAVLHGRRVAGADIVAAYLAIARERIRDAESGRLKRRLLGTPVYEPMPNTSLTSSPFLNRASVI